MGILTTLLIKNVFNKNCSIKIVSSSHEGFDFSYLSNDYRYIRNDLYGATDIKRLLKIIQESGDLINTTKTPKVFFERYLLVISILNELIPIQRHLSFKGKKPSQLKKELQAKEILTVNDFLDRYYDDTLSKISIYKTVKAKQNKIISFSNEIDKYSRYMTNESLKKFTAQYEQLKRCI